MLANILTLSRILVFSPLLFYAISFNNVPLLLFSILAGILTDILDGIAARSLNQITKIGKAIDPLADKIFMLGLLIAIWYKFEVSNLVWFIPFIPTFFIEFTLLTLGIYAFYKKGFEERLGANKWGKIKFSLQCIGGTLIIINYYLFSVSFLIIYIIFFVSNGFGVASIYRHLNPA